MTDELARRLRDAQRRVDQDTGEAKAVAARGVRVQQHLAELARDSELHAKVAQLLTRIGEERQQVAQAHVEGLVTRGLQVIFDEDLSFHLVQSVKASQAQVDFVIRSPSSGEVIETPVMEARGGGMVAAVAFMLRLVVLLLTPGARRMLVLDESFAHLSAEYEPRMAEFLREVCDKAGMQILLVTHSLAYDDVADQRLRLELGPGAVTREVK